MMNEIRRYFASEALRLFVKLTPKRDIETLKAALTLAHTAACVDDNPTKQQAL